MEFDVGSNDLSSIMKDPVSSQDRSLQLSSALKLKRLGIDTQKEFVVYMRSDCHICKSEGFGALNRIQARVNDITIIGTLNVTLTDLLQPGEASLSHCAWEKLKAEEGQKITFSHLPPIKSLSEVRAKMYGSKLSDDALMHIVIDIADGKYSNIHLAAFISACAGDNLDVREIIGLTKAMIATGTTITWGKDLVVDKHCIGGLPGNRTTPLVVSIAAAAGLTIPKTSSRAITSPAGTADTMETITQVELSIEKIKEVVNQEGGCIVWGGAVKLSPADDILIGVERALDIDSEGQMIASVLSKKAAAGSTHVIIDIPVGETAKVRSEQQAEKLKHYFQVVGMAIGLNVKVLVTDGNQPIGQGIGPALEAMDVIAVLRNEGPDLEDLKERALLISGALLELAGIATAGYHTAKQILNSGKAWKKFQAICNAQGGFGAPEYAPHSYDILAQRTGVVTAVDNRKLAKVAKLSGAPHDTLAGVRFYSRLGTKVEKGQTLFTVYAESTGSLNYALDYLKSESEILTIV